MAKGIEESTESWIVFPQKRRLRQSTLKKKGTRSTTISLALFALDNIFTSCPLDWLGSPYDGSFCSSSSSSSSSSSPLFHRPPSLLFSTGSANSINSQTTTVCFILGFTAQLAAKRFNSLEATGHYRFGLQHHQWWNEGKRGRLAEN